MMRCISSTPNGEHWIRYARRAAQYGAQLREMGPPPDHAERRRVYEAIRHGVAQAQREHRKHQSARRLIAALSANKKALAAA